MLRALLTTAICAAPLFAQSPSGVVINELSYDDSGADDLEFIELYNASAVPVDISGWTLNEEDGSSTAGNVYTVPPGTILAPGDFWVVGQVGVPNVDDLLTYSLENGPDGVFLNDLGGTYQDGVCWEVQLWSNPLPVWLEGDGLGGDIQLHENVGNFNSISRSIDGLDTDDNGCDFRPAPWTPGTLNVLGMTTALPYSNDFDGVVGDNVDADFTYSFVAGNVQDPALLTQPAISIPASPQGGNVAVWHDTTGGGNANWLKNFSQADYQMEAWVYFTGPNAAMDADDGEFWTMGVRGHSDSFGEYQSVGGFHGLVNCTTTQSGHTGIAWTCIRTASVCELYLVDYNNGAGIATGGDFTVLAGPISIQAGVNDGWQRVRVGVIGGNVYANFGGTYGVDDGAQFAAATSTLCANGVYLTYRECVTNNNNMLPLITDALQISTPGAGPLASFTTNGGGCPSPVGLSSLSAPQLPVIGATLEVQMDNLSPTGVPLMIIGFTPVAPGFPIAVLGLTPDITCLAEVSLDALVGPLATIGSTASVTLPLPPSPPLAGTPLYFQGTQLELLNGNWSLTEQGLATVGF